MAPPRAKFVRAEDLAVGLGGSALLLVMELVALVPSAAPLRAAWVVAGLFAAVGLLIALLLSMGRFLAERARTRNLALVVRCLPLILVVLPVSRTLFEGAFASTLPGARFAIFWVPLLAVALTTVALHFGEALVRTPLGRAGLGVALPVLAVEIDLLNRNLLASEYADLHTFGLLVSATLAGIGLRLLIERFRPFGLQWPWGPSGILLRLGTWAGFFLLVGALAFGLRDKASRRSIADHGMHGRLLDRVAKALFDLDGDGHALVLGGGECDELAAEVHPDAREVVGNGIDEDCDGQDLTTPWTLPGDAARRDRLARWRSEPHVEAFARKVSRLNVLLFVVDALRADPFVPGADSLRAYPNFFDLRRRGRWFTRAFSPAAGTDLSMTGVLTGKANPMAGSELTLPETFAAAGYRSHAVIPAEVLRFASPTMLTRGFHKHDIVDPGQRNAPGADGLDSGRITDLGLGFIDRWARDPDRPFFLWLHYFDVHEHTEISAESPPLVAANGGVPPVERADKYRALVRVVDGALGRMLGDLRRRGLDRNTIVVLLSDHGESLKEHPRLPEKHGRFLYNPLVHVPMVMLVPGLAPAEIAHPVSLLDIPATLLDLLGMPPEPDTSDFQGESLLPLLLDGPPSLFEPPRILPLHESDQFGLIAWPHKLLYRPAANLTELYHLGTDFAESKDLAESEPELVRSLLSAYRAFPAVVLDRTSEGRKLWDMKAGATRPDKQELAALAARMPRPAPGIDWRPLAVPRRAPGGDVEAILPQRPAAAVTTTPRASAHPVAKKTKLRATPKLKKKRAAAPPRPKARARSSRTP
jgi:arylsulfatase A-like enzyme